MLMVTKQLCLFVRRLVSPTENVLTRSTAENNSKRKEASSQLVRWCWWRLLVGICFGLFVYSRALLLWVWCDASSTRRENRAVRLRFFVSTFTNWPETAYLFTNEIVRMCIRFLLQPDPLFLQLLLDLQIFHLFFWFLLNTRVQLSLLALLFDFNFFYFSSLSVSITPCLTTYLPT